MRSDRHGLAHTFWHAHMGWACPNLLFLERPSGTAGHAQHGTYWHRNGGEGGMFNRVEELLKGGQRWKQLWEANSYGVSLRTTVYTPKIRVATVYRPPNYGDLPTL
jgi:hypothetical protein